MWQHQQDQCLLIIINSSHLACRGASDGQWPELGRLICPNKKDSSSSRSKAVSDNPAIADWFFYHRISRFVDAFYTDVLGVVDFWYRF